MRGRKPRLQLPYAQWPTADRLLWKNAMAADDPFGECVGARLAKSSQENYLVIWRRFLGFLTAHERTALEIAPIKRITMERVRAFVAHLAATNSPRSVASHIGAFYHAVRLMIPEGDWSWLNLVKNRLHGVAPVAAPAGPVITSIQLFELGEQLIDESKPQPDTRLSMDDAVRYRDGFMIAFLALIPIRRKNLAALEIGRHLVREGDRWFVIIPAEEAKTGKPIEFPVPTMLEPYLVTYLHSIRPRILRDQNCAALWVSSQDGPLSYGMIGTAMRRRSMSRVGFCIAAHDARDAAATTWAIFAPNEIGVARDLLAHSDLRTTTKYYNRATGIEASRAHSHILAEVRKKRNQRS
jgi:integrase